MTSPINFESILTSRTASSPSESLASQGRCRHKANPVSHVLTGVCGALGPAPKRRRRHRSGAPCCQGCSTPGLRREPLHRCPRGGDIGTSSIAISRLASRADSSASSEGSSASGLIGGVALDAPLQIRPRVQVQRFSLLFAPQPWRCRRSIGRPWPPRQGELRTCGPKTPLHRRRPQRASARTASSPSGPGRRRGAGGCSSGWAPERVGEVCF